MIPKPVAAEHGLDCRVEQITPAIAAKYLELNVANRPCAPSTVTNYVAAMQRGEWMLNGDAIRFDWNGKLVDGQHRLHAVVKSRVTCPFLVIRGLDPQVFKTIDTGKNRTTRDVLAVAGVPEAKLVGTALRLLHRTLIGNFRNNKRITNSELETLRLAHPKFVNVALEAHRAPYATPLVSPSQLMYCYYVALHVDAPRARRFFRVLAGRPDPDQPADFQAEKLRAWLTKTMEEIVKPAANVRMSWIIQAWNASIEGRPADRFSRIVDEQPEWEPMPRFNR